MGEVRYSEKEIIIFNGLINLIKKGCNPYTIKVSDIARAADIGKGTVYDYFDSKEEAISKAIIYYIDKEIRRVHSDIGSQKSFKDKFFKLLYNIKDNYDNNVSLYNLLLSAGGLSEFYEYLTEIECDSMGFKDIVENVLDNILNTGIEEGIIDVKNDPYYLNMALRGSIAGFSHYISRRKSYKNITIEKAMDVSFEILLKSLS